MKRSPLKRKSPMKRGGKRLRSRRLGRSPEAKAYAAEHPTCELCAWLEGEAWELWRSRDFRPCIAAEVHHCWTPPRFDGPENYVHSCGPAHSFVETFARFGRLVCCSVKIASGEFDRELIRDRWHRDPIDAIDSDIQRGLMGVPVETWEPFWTLVRESDV